MSKFREGDFFMVFSNCMLVVGATRSTICDLLNNRIVFIPNAFADFLNKCKQRSLLDLLSEYLNESDIIIENIESLIENNYGTVVDKNELERFPELELDWDIPYTISNSILDYSELSDYDLECAVLQLLKLRCKHLQIRFFL